MKSVLRKIFGADADRDGTDVDIAWGGYYVSLEGAGGGFRVFRLLDFSQSAYHAALFREKFESRPTLAEVTALAPYVMHVPIDSRGLVSPPIQLLGATPLSAEALGGYMFYLEQHGVPADEREKLIAKLVAFSQEAPLRLKLRVIGDQLQIAQRP